MRHEVRSKIAAGESPGEIKAWLVARYGNWVSYDPPFDGATAFLWLGPLLFLAIGGWLAFGRRSEEHTSELQSLMRISYAVFCLKKKKDKRRNLQQKQHQHNST